MRIAFALNWKTILAGAAAFVIGALAVSFSGLVSVAASSGHYGPVSWFLHWTMQNAVGTQSALIAVPDDVDLADPSLAQRAAGHFATGCAPCHGAPGAVQSPVVLSMMPPPPRLEALGGKWQDRELFWIVQHGIKYSGMPAWASQERPDEAWAMVAFLKALPGLDEPAYAAMALGAGEAGKAGPPRPGLAAAETALADCARCHGLDGQGVGTGERAGAFPVIAGQPEPYLAETLRAYSAGHRQSGIMQPAARRYDDAVLRKLAAHYAAQPATATAAGSPSPAPADEAGPPPSPSARAIARLVSPAAAHGPPDDRKGLLDLGRSIAEEGLPARKLPSCDSCHGRKGRAKNAHYPRIAGQPAWYLSTHLHLWKERKRAGTPYAHLMDKIAIHLTDEHIEALALWYSTQPAGR